MLTGASTNLSMTWIWGTSTQWGAPPHNAVDELDMWRAPCLVHSLDHGSLSWHRNRHIHDRRVMNSIKRLNLRNFDCLLGCRDEHLASRHNWHIHSPLLHSFIWGPHAQRHRNVHLMWGQLHHRCGLIQNLAHWHIDELFDDILRDAFLGHPHNSTAGCSGTSMFCSTVRC